MSTCGMRSQDGFLTTLEQMKVVPHTLDVVPLLQCDAESALDLLFLGALVQGSKESNVIESRDNLPR